MTRFALGAKCGWRGARGLGEDEDGGWRMVDGEALEAAKVLSRRRRDAMAILPTPTPHWEKKWRRVTVSRRRWIRWPQSAIGNRQSAIFIAIPSSPSRPGSRALGLPWSRRPGH